MGKLALSSNVDQLLEAPRLSRQEGLCVPVLLIAYAGIDILASLDPPAPDAFTERRFVAWVERYLLPQGRLRCNGLDLYLSTDRNLPSTGAGWASLFENAASAAVRVR